VESGGVNKVVEKMKVTGDECHVTPVPVTVTLDA
jgi:hypothetical protein